MHSDLYLAPVYTIAFPASHFLQSFSAVAFDLSLLYVFWGHGVQVALVDFSLSMYIPKPQLSGAVIPMRGQVVPRGQDLQASFSFVFPSTLPYLPNGHV